MPRQRVVEQQVRQHGSVAAPLDDARKRPDRDGRASVVVRPRVRAVPRAHERRVVRVLEDDDGQQVEGPRVIPRGGEDAVRPCLLYTSPSPRDAHESRMPSSA